VPAFERQIRRAVKLSLEGGQLCVGSIQKFVVQM
jgi:hypothetical protein